MTTNDENAGDGRTEAQWIGDIAHRTLERLEQLRPELATLMQQFRFLQRWCDTQGMSSAAFMLERYEGFCAELGDLNVAGAAATARGVVAATGRPKQEYHHYR